MAAVGARIFFIYKKTFKELLKFAIHNSKIRNLQKKQESAIHGLIHYFWADFCKNPNPTRKLGVDCQP